MRLDELGLVGYLQAVWKVAVLLKLDLLRHGAVHEGLGVGEEESAEETCFLSHHLALKDFVNLFWLTRHIFLVINLCHFVEVYFQIIRKIATHVSFMMRIKNFKASASQNCQLI